MRRQIGRVQRVEDEPHLVRRGDMADRLHFRLEGDHLLRLKPRRRDTVRLPPGIGAADQGGHGEDGERTTPDGAEARREAGEQESRSREQKGDPRNGDPAA